MKQKPVTLADLCRAQVKHGHDPQLLCTGECMGTYSATPGDYFQYGPEHVFRCCGEPMHLVVLKARFVDVRL